MMQGCKRLELFSRRHHHHRRLEIFFVLLALLLKVSKLELWHSVARSFRAGGGC